MQGEYRLLKLILFFILTANIFALEISMNSAKDDFKRYSTLKLTNTETFLCQEHKDEFMVTTEVICAFSKRPSKVIKQLQNDFFKVTTFIKKDTYFIKIQPHYKIKLIADIFDLTKDNTVYSANVTVSKRWMIIGYKETLPLISNPSRPDISLNFPFFMDRDTLPYVGSLDINGNPVHIQKVGDVTEYLKVKRYYKEKKYEKCMNVVGDILQEYPNTLFKAELIYYKIRVFTKLKDYDNVISNAKEFLREYSSSDNIAEVLALVGQAYSQIGMGIDADYFFDRLFNEHTESKYALWGYIYKGESLESCGEMIPAIKFYEKALYGTKDLDVAANAAFHIALAKFDTSISDSAKYIDKIIQAKPSHFSEEYDESKILMKRYADQESYLTASKIAGALLDSIDPTYDDYETLLSEKALWLSQTPEKKKALISLNKYIKLFPDGYFINEVDVAKDALFFETSDSNATARLLEFDKLMKTYPNDTIGDRAIYEKAKLLLAEKMYFELLAFKPALLSIDEEKYNNRDRIIKDAAIGVMKVSLEAKECHEVLIVSNEYNISLSDKWDDGVYECAMKGGDHTLGKSIAKKNLKSDKLSERKKWLYRYIRVDFATGNYSKVIDASKDLITLIEDDKESEYKDVYRYLFDSYDRIEHKNKMLDVMVMIEKEFGLTYKDIERYISIMSIGSDLKDDNMVVSYANKVMNIQKSSSSHVQSPYVEFTLYQAYINKAEYTNALATISVLDSVDISNKDRARQKYLKGTVLNKLWRDTEAREAYKEAISADPNSAWAKLATTAQGI
jgi:tetratricopeptide (TPR) repeat protein